MQLVFSPAAAETIRHLPPTAKRGIRQALRSIAQEPSCGQPLQRELAGYFKYKVSRFRVVYTASRARRLVRVVAVGLRATIYRDLAAYVRGEGEPPEPT